MADRDETVPHVAAVRELALEGEAAVGAPVGDPAADVRRAARRVSSSTG